MAKKPEGDKIKALLQFKTYDELLEAARFHDTPLRTRESFRKPKFHKAIFGHPVNPCKLVGCSNTLGCLSDVSFFEKLKLIIVFFSMLAAIACIPIFLLGGFFSLIVPPTNEIYFIHPVAALIIVCISILILLVSNYYFESLHWNLHHEDLQKKCQKKLKRDPAKAIIKYLNSLIGALKEDALGNKAMLRVIQFRLERHLKEAVDIEEQLSERIRNGAATSEDALVSGQDSILTRKAKIENIKKVVDYHVDATEDCFTLSAEDMEDLRAEIDDLAPLYKALSRQPDLKKKVEKIEKEILAYVQKIFAILDKMRSALHETFDRHVWIFHYSSDSDLQFDSQTYMEITEDMGLPEIPKDPDPPDEQDEEEEEEFDPLTSTF